MSDAPFALFFGAWSPDHLGHYVYTAQGRKIYEAKRDFPGIPWDACLMDSGLLCNGEHPDVPDGKVFWTCGGRGLDRLWHAFFWWDRSGDRRGNSNSGFYTFGFPHKAEQEAFGYACGQFPAVVARQRAPLVLQVDAPRAHVTSKDPV